MPTVALSAGRLPWPARRGTLVLGPQGRLRWRRNLRPVRERRWLSRRRIGGVTTPRSFVTRPTAAAGRANAPAGATVGSAQDAKLERATNSGILAVYGM